MTPSPDNPARRVLPSNHPDLAPLQMRWKIMDPNRHMCCICCEYWDKCEQAGGNDTACKDFK